MIPAGSQSPQASLWCSRPMTGIVRRRASGAPADGRGGHQVLEQGERDLARHGIGIELRLLGILQEQRLVELAEVDLPHGPAAEATLEDLLVVQQRDVLVARVALDVAEQLGHLQPSTLDGLQED